MKRLVLASLALAFVGLFAGSVQAGTLLLTVDASNPKWDSGALVSSNVLENIYVRLYGGNQGGAKTLLDAQPWAPIAKFRRDNVAAGMKCYESALGLDTDGDKVPDRESPHTAEWCGTGADPAPVLNLAAPNGITGQAPAP